MGADVCGDTNSWILGVSTDSRSIKSGECFFAIEGEQFNGHDYVSAAFKKGAACAVVNADWNGGSDGCLLKVKDTIEALGILAKEYRKLLSAKIVGITGSAGKTTSREMLYQVLSSRFKVYRSPKSFNNNIGVPLTILMAEGNEDVLIVEMGTNHPGEIEYLTRIVQPDIAVITSVYPAHLEGLGGIDGVIKEKSSIAEGLSPQGRFIINGMMPALVEHCRTKGYRFITFGRSKGCDISGYNIGTDGERGWLTIDDVKVVVPAPGDGMIDNAIGVWAVAREFGLTAQEFADSLKRFTPASMRTEVLKLKRATVISDCYNANPGSMKNALGVLASMKGGRKVFVCGPMKELGSMTDTYHAELGRQIAEAGVDLLLTAGPMDATVRAAGQSSGGAVAAMSFINTQELVNKLRELVRQDDIILVKGSRAVGLELAVAELKKIFG